MILVTYLYFCLYAGPRYMAKRKPFKLETVLIAYNAIQVALSILLVYEVSVKAEPIGHHLNTTTATRSHRLQCCPSSGASQSLLP